ncbi:hypothetical protein UFOVP62_45 [uncultured Caudovirales phage]|uniref:Uncharacterized protein n=1 Tax=uncultured Caudovirales phage TaxID=2100421 RepID=A0A6J5KUY6_9CAUD|nr:hypothetical protein UFOVP62_45 [uncultured Caudovirales phage]
MRVMGIDPGVSGAMAIIHRAADGALRVESVQDLPTLTELTTSGKARRRVDPVGLAAMVQAAGPCDRVIVERLVAGPGVASITAFSMGASAACIGAVFALAHVTIRLVSPNAWKRGLGAPADKEASRRFACELFGEDANWKRVKDHNRAEAALIAAFGAMG